MKFKIINGTVIDPTQKINGKIQDIFVEDGYIKNPSSSEASKYNIIYEDRDIRLGGPSLDNANHLVPE